jgi:hypothetical protein
MKICEFDKIDLLNFATGSCDDHESRRIKSHLLACHSCRCYVEAYTTQAIDFLHNNPYSASGMPDAVISTRKIAPFRLRTIYGIAASLAILCTTMYFYNHDGNKLLSRVKGETGLELVVKNNRGQIEKRDMQAYYGGERIQFLYSCARRNKFILVSMDSAGAVTQYYPRYGDSSEVLEPGQDVPLSHSILLDEYTGREMFIGVFSEKKLRAAEVRDRLLADFIRTKSFDSIALPDKNVTLCKHIILAVKGVR